VFQDRDAVVYADIDGFKDFNCYGSAGRTWRGALGLGGPAIAKG
jgi:hypothetical protein